MLYRFDARHGHINAVVARQYIGKGQDGGRSNITGGKRKEALGNRSNELTCRQFTDDDSEVTPPARQSPEMTSLPDPELSNLKEIADIFTAAHTLNEKDKISTFITIEVKAGVPRKRAIVLIYAVFLELF